MTERRPDRGLLGGMLGLPTSEWGDAPPNAEFPCQANWQEVGEVRHVFTHFVLTLTVWRAQTHQTFSDPQQTADALPSVFAKALKLALPAQ